MQVLRDAGRFGAQAGGEPHWVEHLSVRDLSVGTYSIPSGGVDTQEPHTEDEVYVVLRGRGALATATATVEVAPGTTIHVPAGESHRFVDIVEDLVVLVLFAPAEGSQAPP
jgi:mannose-6-phosphate isomerase-like protein (cupin superfamily)